MKTILKAIFSFFLLLCAHIVIRRYRPRIVMVTGSVGKTSTKDAVATALAARYAVRKSEKSYNSEFGVPFTILGVKNPWESPLAWLHIMKRALALMILPNHYPNLLVLETGADRPGDLAHILHIATPDMVVVTRLPEVPVHVEAYPSPEAVREEEFLPAFALPPAAPLIISADDPHAIAYAKQVPARIVLYGYSADASVWATNADFYTEDKEVAGMQAEVSTANGDHAKLVVKGAVGRTQLLPLLAALAAAQAFDIPFNEAMSALSLYESPPGRGRLLQGIQNTHIIDDSYNSSPVAVEEALDTLKKFPSFAKATEGKPGRKIAVLGDMLELGRYSVAEHERIAKLAGTSADIVVAVGIRARAFALAGQASATPNAKVLFFDDSNAAAAALPEHIQPNDVILVKGSQGIRMERIVEALLADPDDAHLLVRQERAWKRRV